jgi:phosphoglycolate phosphatase
LSDPYAGISRSYLHALNAIGRDALDEPALRELIGPPLHAVFATLCADERDRIPEAIAAFRERYARVGLFENTLYAGIPDVLEQLAQTRTLYVCTSKPRVYAIQILEHFGIAHYFRAIYGSELDGTRGDKRELLAWLLENEGVDPAGATMIGDRYYDIEAALATRVAAVAVLWGYGKRAELESAGAQRFVAEPAALQSL